MKKLILSMMMLSASLGAFADGTALKVSFTDGSSATFVLSDKPRVSFSGDDMNIVSSDASTSYPRQEIASITFIDSDAGVDGILSDKLVYRYDGNAFEAQGLDISVYSISGALMTQGRDAVSLASVPAGIYIVKAGNQSIKIRKN